MSKARITYRFDRHSNMPPPEEHAIELTDGEQEKSSSAIIPLYQKDTDYRGTRSYGAWKSPFDEEAERIEQLIRSAEMEHDNRQRAGKDSSESRPLYYTAEDENQAYEQIPFYEDPTMPSVSVTYRRTRKRTNWFGMTSAVMGAVLTGIVLGMFVLSIFRGDSNEPMTAGIQDGLLLPGMEAVLGGGVGAISEDADALDDATVEQAALVGTVQVQLPAWTLYFVQNGVFSSQEGALAAADQLKDKGLAGAVEAGDKWMIYAGAAADRDDALLISHQLQDAGLEIYIKPYELPAVSALPWTEASATELQDYVVQSRHLVTAILSASMQHINEVTPSAVPEEQMKQLKSDHQQWTTAANAVMNDAPAQMKNLLQSMNTAINSAMIAMDQYNKKPSAAYLWQVQSAIMDHVIKQNELLISGENMI